MPPPYFKGLKTMGLPVSSAQAARPHFFSPYSFVLGMAPSSGGVVSKDNAFFVVPGNSGLSAQGFIYDPTDYVVRADGTPFLKGTITVLSGQTVYKATDAEQTAAVSITFETATPFGNQSIQTYYFDRQGTGAVVRTAYHAGSLYPAGTATNYQEQTFFPGNGPPFEFFGDNLPALGGSVYGPVEVNVGVTAPGPYYSNCTLDTIIAYPRPDASGNMTSGWIYFPPRPLDYDIWAPAGKYLVGHITFPPGSFYEGEMQQQFYFGLSALYIMRDAAPPYVTRQNDEYNLPSVIAGERDIAGQPGGDLDEWHTSPRRSLLAV